MKESTQDEILDSVQDLITSIFFLESIIQKGQDIPEFDTAKILNKIKVMTVDIEELNGEIEY